MALTFSFKARITVSSSPGTQASLVTLLDFYYKATQLLNYGASPKLRIQIPVISFRVSRGGSCQEHFSLTYMEALDHGLYQFHRFLLLLEAWFHHSRKCIFSVSGWIVAHMYFEFFGFSQAQLLQNCLFCCCPQIVFWVRSLDSGFFESLNGWTFGLMNSKAFQ